MGHVTRKCSLICCFFFLFQIAGQSIPLFDVCEEFRARKAILGCFTDFEIVYKIVRLGKGGVEGVKVYLIQTTAHIHALIATRQQNWTALVYVVSLWIQITATHLART